MSRELTELLRRLERFEESLGSIRQYIGARYVPKFIDDPWTDTIQYEELSVVSVGGTSYISGERVPIGTPISDRNYWHIYGASSGAIINLQNQIDDMNDGNVPGSLQAQIDGNTSEILALANKTNPNNKKFWYIGDSFLYDANGWGTAIDNFLGKTDSLKTADGGMGFNKVGQIYGYNIPDLINTITPDSNITDVIVIAGTNDCTSANFNVSANVAQTIANIKSKLPNAKIWFGFNGTYLKTGYSDYPNRFGYVGDVEYNIKNGAKGNNVSYMRSVGYSMQWSALCLDSAGVHLTPTGYELMGRAIINHLFGGGDNTLTWWTSFHGLRWNVCNLDTITIEAERMGIDLYNDSSNPLTINGMAFTDVYTNAGCPLLPRHTYQFAVPCILEFVDSTNNRYRHDGCVILMTTDDKVRVFSPTAHNNIVEIVISSPASITKPIFVHQH